MTAKEYLQQAFHLDQRINSKLEQIESLSALATKVTATYSDLPKSPNKGTSNMENIIVKIIDLQEELNREIDSLVELKKELMEVIAKVEDKEERTVLEKRYLCFSTFEQIAVDMNYSIQHIFRIHGRALERIEIQ